jgi:anti-sigma factor RsiW
MSDHITSEHATKYLHGQLIATALLVVDDHLAACEQCRRELIAQRPDATARLIRSLSAFDHLNSEEMERLIEGSISPEEEKAIELHLAECAHCSAETDDLRSFIAAAPGPRRRNAFLAFAAALIIAIAIGGFVAQHVMEREVVPQLRISIRDGNAVLTLSENGGVAGAPAGSERMIRALLTTREMPFSRGMTMPEKQMLRGSAAPKKPLRVVFPISRVVLDDRPDFGWTTDERASSFIVKVFTVDMQPILRSPVLRDRHWRPERPLPRGEMLFWQLTEISGEERVIAPQSPDPPAMFKIVDAATAAEIAEALRERSHLVSAALYARAGMRVEAAAELEALSKLNPGSRVVRDLMNSLDVGGRR